MKVLISPGYGAGWSTWNTKELATDKRVIEAFESGMDEDEMEDFLEKLGYKDVYMGGYYDCEIVEVPKGSRFIIEEYDGHESILILGEDNTFYAEE